jgi:tetratricopeptide (TPR) repeat protein
MANLNKTKLLAIFLFIAIVFNSYSQDWKKIQDAYSKSYAYEYKKEYSKAIEEIKNIYDEKSYSDNLRLGWLNYINAQYTESVKYYQKAITLMPYSVEAKLGYINPAAVLGNWDNVIKQYKDILTIDKNNYLINYRLGAIYYNRKDYKTAYEYVKEAANQYPFDYDINILYAWTNYQLGKFTDAKILFNKALLLRPLDSSAIEGLKLIK